MSQNQFLLIFTNVGRGYLAFNLVSEQKQWPQHFSSLFRKSIHPSWHFLPPDCTASQGCSEMILLSKQFHLIFTYLNFISLCSNMLKGSLPWLFFLQAKINNISFIFKNILVPSHLSLLWYWFHYSLQLWAHFHP